MLQQYYRKHRHRVLYESESVYKIAYRYSTGNEYVNR